MRGSIVGTIIGGTVGVVLAAATFLRTDAMRGFAPAILVAFVPLSVFNVVRGMRELRNLQTQTSEVGKR